MLDRKPTPVSKFGLPDSIRSAIPGVDHGTITQIVEYQPYLLEIQTDDGNNHFLEDPTGTESALAVINARRKGLGGSGCPLYEVVSIELF